MSGPDKLYRWMDGAHVHTATMAHPAYDCTEYIRADLHRSEVEAAADRIEALAQERDAAVERAREFSRYLAVETMHAEDAEDKLVLALDALQTAKSEIRDWAFDHPSMLEINAVIAQIKGEQE